MKFFADILLPVPGGTYTYLVGEGIVGGLTEGMAVAVQFGKRKIQTGIVWRLHNEKPAFATKEIEKILLPGRVVTPEQMLFWEWMASYYMATLGDVMRFALPASLKPAGMTPEEFSRDEYRPRTVKYVSLHPSVAGEEALNELCESLRRSRAQYAAVMEVCALLGDDVFGGEVARERLSVSTPILKKLTDRGALAVTEREAATEDAYVAGQGTAYRTVPGFTLPQLTDAQSNALEGIRAGFADHSTVLLHGVTGSGKTEIYMHLIAEQLARGKSVLYLMPEIAMTSQLVARVRRVFGERVTVYHSMLSDRRRAEAYRRLGAGRGGELVLGVRSSVFLPLPDPGLIIVDEEHDASYKQSDNAPRYYARDCAVWMARTSGAGCLLASATPSIESYVNALAGKYGLVTLSERYGDARLPQTVISDTLLAVKRGERKSHFNKLLLDRMGETLAAGRQIMLFQNRRGFAPYIECGECGWTLHCPRCSVTLSYHKQDGRMRCHTCGLTAPVPSLCPECGSMNLKPQGFGTEKIEEELARLFPGAGVVRLDRDTATTIRKAEAIISEFERGGADIMVGTQMVTKGFDFPRLSLVGVLNADNLLNYPDFRASERAYQIMTQVAGRAGRSDDSGQVIIQTSQPEHPVIRQVQSLDYPGMMNGQLAERKAFGYPPYGRLISVSMKHYRKELVEEGAEWLARQMRAVFGERVYGPHAPAIEKISNENYLNILLKVENGRSFGKVKELLGQMIAEMGRKPGLRNISVACDVDPQ